MVVLATGRLQLVGAIHSALTRGLHRRRDTRDIIQEVAVWRDVIVHHTSGRRVARRIGARDNDTGYVRAVDAPHVDLLVASSIGAFDPKHCTILGSVLKIEFRDELGGIRSGIRVDFLPCARALQRVLVDVKLIANKHEF
jgi:hypothetical protein